MKKALTGKHYFAWLGWIDAQAGRPILKGRAGRLRWPMWARSAYAKAWLTYPKRETQ